MKKKILVTGGPVHAHLDAVKIITNKFKGGLMMRLADELGYDNEVTYLTTAGTPSIVDCSPCGDEIYYKTIYHQGFNDYYEQVLKLAPQMDAVILGAAVANLIPINPWKGKFPSHNYKVGDIIPIDFTIAPRVITEVKKVAPNTHLFGFKLLSEVPHEELITAAYEIVLSSKATAVFANDATDLQKVFMVTKERGVHPMPRTKIAEEINKMINDEYYHTVVDEFTFEPMDMDLYFKKLIHDFSLFWTPVPEGYVFGCVATRQYGGLNIQFRTTSRGKNKIGSPVYVYSVDHNKRVIRVSDKASLNAPLLEYIFRNNLEVNAIVHLHRYMDNVPLLPYAPPGTVRDSIREIKSSFNIEGHGCFILLDTLDVVKGWNKTLNEINWSKNTYEIS
jgi:hypothetical protein